jgi:hypothetical protein
MKNSETIIKIVLAIVLFLCLLDMPYGFYQLVRFMALIGFGILAYKANEQNKNTEMIVYGGLTLLFQPFFKIALGREMWNIVDVIVGIGLIASLFMNRTKSQRQKPYTFAIRTSQRYAKNCKRVCLANAHFRTSIKTSENQAGPGKPAYNNV